MKKSVFRISTEAAVDRVIDGAGEVPDVIIGPIVWQPDQHGKRCWYFIVVASSGRDGFRVNQIVADNQRSAVEMRSAFMRALVRRRPIVVHDCDDELYAARMAEAIWPCAKTRDIVAGIEAERAQWSTA